MKTFVAKQNEKLFIVKADTKKDAHKKGLPLHLEYWTSYNFPVENNWLAKGFDSKDIIIIN